MTKMVRGFLALAFCLTLTMPALAGIADSPLPVLEAGKPTFHLYSVPGVRGGASLGTFFSCTSTDTVPMKVAVELFHPVLGVLNDAVATSFPFSPGYSATLATDIPLPCYSTGSSLCPSSFPNDLLTGSGFGGPFAGSARILATSKRLVCTVFLADIFSEPPTSMVHLNIVAKTKQKGD